MKLVNRLYIFKQEIKKMEKKKVVFFVSVLSPRCNKRILDFIKHDYDVDVYCFFKDEGFVKYEYDVQFVCNRGVKQVSFLSRFRRFTPKIKQIVEQYDRNNTIFYFFSLNTAIATLFLRKIDYFYEESDMLFGHFKSNVLKKITKEINTSIIIKKSKLTIFTSDGFAKYYFGDNVPKNIITVPNKVDSRLLNIPEIEKRIPDFNKLRFGFIGVVRFYTIYNIAILLTKNFPMAEFHFYGKIMESFPEKMEELSKCGRVFFHGTFVNPDDLPNIYSNIDFVISTYDIRMVNSRYAEPNKIYESMFFRTPIIVSSNSFLADKVEKLGIGFSVNPLDENDVVEKIKAITPASYNQYLSNLNAIDRKDAVNNTEYLFERIKEI